MAYCIYTGASSIIQDVKLGDAIARNSMNTFLRALRGGCTTCPVVQRSVDIIITSLQNDPSPSDAISPLEMNLATEHSNNPSRSYAPAFPHINWQIDDLNQVANSSLTDSDALFLLECFPENHINSEGNDWYMPS
jgi:hypothetical protein